MRAVIQRVRSASVEVDGRLVSSIGPGLLCLIGIRDTDTAADQEFLCRKLLNFRIWPSSDGSKSWDQNVSQKGYELLLVSQFTLYAMAKGNKPDYHLAMPPDQAKDFYSEFLERVRRGYQAVRVKDGVFGAMMDVSLVNDGPVTLNFDSQYPTGRC
ncbi:D-tyrosyl-tRNA deacylase [Coccomyxa subellipsoidea C-169]|uniref:D-aminoacyl-tRNA deacylase n=1 Tax=Coccomyxa subellipsoidea (strain C-169) TaxID=574566 RepID=I0Z2G0_COCSC|nr:D-tyrosyl-tRNA deacylase [Coccomyxa subellipsoidea C-169]EIE24829.1 D-tyrosyl-tRNA deacylase [Coccomyxa subellipsoidea C-169]|eukprot:XP_005649373.1 D-tyrosyl-tRNA deacylase [Coccomyxa subellipsoidea C-169]